MLLFFKSWFYCPWWKLQSHLYYIIMQRIANTDKIKCLSQCTNSLMLSAVNFVPVMSWSWALLPCKTRLDETSPSCAIPQQRTVFRQGWTNKIEKSFQCYTSGIPAFQGTFATDGGSRTDDQFPLIKFKVTMKSNQILGQCDPDVSGHSAPRCLRKLYNLLTSLLLAAVWSAGVISATQHFKLEN